ncbi:MAG: hypothetical protein IT331_17600 [Anaerolineae bacterium]|nr:hypothetical protein [Anaerolineae bacterium]
MSPRLKLVFDLLLMALVLGGLIVLGISGTLLVSGTFSWVWLARLVVVAALLALAIEAVVLRRSLRVTHVRGPLGSWRMNDRTQGCTLALLGGVLVAGLMVCGVLMEYLFEWQ